MMNRRLIVNADDLGYSLGVTEGIIRAHKEGIVTSATLMVNMSAAAESVKQVREQAPFLALGLHLNLTAGRPLSDVPDLISSDGSFDRKTAMIARLNILDLAQVERELRAQVEYFITLTGRQPDHLDSHHHITYLHPSLLALMTDIARELNAPIRRPFPTRSDISKELLIDFGLADDELTAMHLLNELSEFMMQVGVITPDGFVGTFFRETATLGDLLNTIMDIPDGITEIMCHPGLIDDDLRRNSSYVEHREKELHILCQPALKELMLTEKIELATFGSLME